ncbi:hypothetical protein NU10_02545 [Flavobacterium dauae]|uniref:hypothetical protein n=1 Tax=Flavobacterium dauae TaxID=1563479 RepID=UPI00101C3E33|nr:hypothetical protein [Flavobacterium dauae]WLD24299.1 hypothetical protein NU10_02545 [Flavobacterium dauae]
MKRLLLMSLIVSVSFSCNNINVQKKNRESDKKEGEKVLNVYFENVLSNNMEKNLQLFSKGFFEKTPQDVFIKRHISMDEKLGKVIGRSLTKWETNIVKGTKPESEYYFVYDVKREKYNSKEFFYLIKEPTDSIKINLYKVESEGLLTE